MKPIIKYPGGKEKELPVIVKALPNNISRYYEPFVGGGAVFFGVDWAGECLLNDKSEELISLYDCVMTRNRDFLKSLNGINSIWKKLERFVGDNLPELRRLYEYTGGDKLQQTETFLRSASDLGDLYAFVSPWMNEDTVRSELLKCVFDKLNRTKKIENERGALENPTDFCDNFECAFKRGVYTVLREIFNRKASAKLSKGMASALFFFMREYCYSSMFRYNASGDFNVPYGGISYNHKYMDEKIKYIKSSEMKKKFSRATLGCADFYDFMRLSPPDKDDFVFLDPPYDTEFSSYANNEFSQSDQRRLANYLITECQGNWMLVIKRTDLISSLYPAGTPTANGQSVHVSAFDKKYLVSFKNRNNKNCKHLLITNYEVNYG